MKKLSMVLPLVFLLCFTFSCQDKAAMAELEEFKAQAALEEQNNALVTLYYEELSKGNIEALRELFSPDFVMHSMGHDISLEEGVQALKQQRIMIPDITVTVEDKVFKGDKVIIRNIARGTNTGDLESFPATGNKIEVEAIEILRIENGKFAEGWEVADRLAVYQALGFELKPKEEKK